MDIQTVAFKTLRPSFQEIMTRLENRSSIVGVELGFSHGKNAERMLDFCDILTLCIFDTILEDGVQVILDKYKNRLISHIPMLSWEGACLFDNNSLDFVYIDADHTYDSVKKDLNSWYPKVKSGGIFCGHDYVNVEWTDVKIAVDEFAVENNLQLNSFFKQYDDEYIINRDDWWIIKP